MSSVSFTSNNIIVVPLLLLFLEWPSSAGERTTTQKDERERENIIYLLDADKVIRVERGRVGWPAASLLTTSVFLAFLYSGVPQGPRVG
jgi:hypothetical protein